MKNIFKKVLLLLITVLSIIILNGCQRETSTSEIGNDKEEIKSSFLAKANEVEVTDTQIKVYDESGSSEKIVIDKNPKKVACLYASFATLFYEAGGTLSGCIGGSSAVELYEEYIGRDITEDANMKVLATSGSGSRWSTEEIIATQPDLIICSTAMSGYKTISAPAAAAGIQVVAVDYDDFSDYLKWFKVFSHLTGNEDKWESIAIDALDKVVDIIFQTKNLTSDSLLSLFSGPTSVQANTKNTVVGSMINQLGGNNIVDEWNNQNEAERLDLNLESIITKQPACILISCHSSEEEAIESINNNLGNNPLWNELTAVKEGKVFYLPKNLFHNKPNRKFANAYAMLAELIYPDEEFNFNV